MPKPLPSVDPIDFATRLHEALDRHVDRFPTDRGRNQAVARRYKVKTPTSHAWLNGKHMPAPDKALEIADDLGEDFMTLYFGPEVASRYRMVPASQPTRWTASTIENAMAFLDELDEIAGLRPAARPDPAKLAIACEVVTEGEIVGGQSVVVRLANRLRKGG